MIRIILAIVCGFIIGSVCNMAIILLSWQVYPPPANVDLSNTDALKAYVQTLPMPAFLMVLAAHAGGAFAGGLSAACIAKRSHMLIGGIIGGLFLAGGAYNIVTIPSPIWFIVLDLASYLPCGILGAILAQPRTPTSAG